MTIYYLLPVLLIAAALVYSQYMKRQAQNMSPEEAANAFHSTYASYFDLDEGETIVGAWSGVEFQGPTSAAAKLAGDALNAASDAVLGVSTYTPNVYVALTSGGRVLVSREYSEMGDRGHFKQIASFGSGTQAVEGGAAFSGQDTGKPPKNPFNPMVSLELVQLQGPNAEPYAAWMSPQGGRVGQPGFVSIVNGLA